MLMLLMLLLVLGGVRNGILIVPQALLVILRVILLSAREIAQAKLERKGKFNSPSSLTYPRKSKIR